MKPISPFRQSIPKWIFIAALVYGIASGILQTCPTYSHQSDSKVIGANS